MMIGVCEFFQIASVSKPACDALAHRAAGRRRYVGQGHRPQLDTDRRVAGDTHRCYSLEYAHLGRAPGNQCVCGGPHMARPWPETTSDRVFQALQRPALRPEARRHRRAVSGSAQHALVLCCDEKTQIQALDRTQPGLPLKRGRGTTMTHDYKRNGVTTLFAALNVLTGKMLSITDQLHRHQEWLRFLKMIDRNTPKAKQLHLIVDNYATHKYSEVIAWLVKHPRFHLHFTPKRHPRQGHACTGRLE